MAEEGTGVVSEPVAATQQAAAAAAVKLPADAPRFVLGSSSQSRRAILAAAGGDFDIMVPSIDEKAIGDRAGGDAEKLVRLIAEAKADALLARLPGAAEAGDDRVLLTGDQVVTYRGEIREKPRDAEQAREFIASYASAPCETVGAVCLHDLRRGQRVIGTHVAKIFFGPGIAEPTVLDTLAADDVVLCCAGGLMVEHEAVAPHLQRIEGGVDSVMGLSSSLVAELLEKLRASGAE